MANSLLSITPHQVNKDLRGYSVMFYGTPKSGKTTTASRFPGSLLLAFEKGYMAIPGIMAKPINTWGEFRKVLTELKDPEVQKVYQTIVIDTADIAYSYCEKYICARESNEKLTCETLGDVPYGKGYKLAMAEFDECLRKILQMNYGLVIISHSTDKTFKNENGEEYNQIVPTLDNRARLVCERACDIIGFSTIVNDNNGKTATKLFLRGTPRFVAGSRFRYTPDVIDFTYENLCKAISDSIEKEARENNGQYVNDSPSQNNVIKAAAQKDYDFDALMNEFQEIVGDIMTKNPSQATKITKIVAEHLGPGKKVAECTPDQAEQLDLILYDLKRI